MRTSSNLGNRSKTALKVADRTQSVVVYFQRCDLMIYNAQNGVCITHYILVVERFK